MTLLVFGKTGQVAQELLRRAPEATFLGRDAADLGDPHAIARAIADHRPSGVINAAAYTAVDRAETERDAAMAVNGTAPGIMAQACKAAGIPLVHLSTDYVFDGTGTSPFETDDAIGPQNHYGYTKAAGETAIRASGAVFAILRTSWVFSAHGTNFVKTMLRLAGTRDRLTIVADQHGGPTPAAAIADACLAILARLQSQPGLTGSYHFSGAPDTTWAAFAQEIFRQSGHGTTVDAIASADYPTPARRPLNSRLDCTRTETAFGIPRPDWRAGLHEVLTELEATR